jgi:hypothetical protein
MLLALGPVEVEASVFEEAPGAVVEERGRDPLALRVLRIRLHDTTTGLPDQVECSTERGGGDSLAPVGLSTNKQVSR